MKTLVTLFLLLLFVSGCSSSNSTDVVNMRDKNTQSVLVKDANVKRDLEFNIVASSQTPYDQAEYLEGKKETLVFHSDDESEVEKFKEEFTKLTGNEAPEFTGVMVVAKTGAKSSGGYSIDVVSVKDGIRYVEVELRYSTPKGLATTALTNFYTVINIPLTHKDVKVIEVD
jgi:hypothetical protein